MLTAAEAPDRLARRAGRVVAAARPLPIDLEEFELPEVAVFIESVWRSRSTEETPEIWTFWEDASTTIDQVASWLQEALFTADR